MSGAPFAGLRPPRAPTELRGRVLDACRNAATEAGKGALLDRLWRSRLARWAWLATVVALLAGNLALSWPAAGPGGGRATPDVERAGLWDEVRLPVPWQPRPRQATWAEVGPLHGWPSLDVD